MPEEEREEENWAQEEAGDSGQDGLGHHGEPARPEQATGGRPIEEEQEVQEENEEIVPARVVRAPRTPSQSERELHEALQRFLRGGGS